MGRPGERSRLDMITFGCFTCKTSWLVVGEDEEVKRLLGLPEWKDSVPCPTDLCGGRAIRGAANDVPIEMNVGEFYRLISGQGTAPQKKVLQLLFESPIVHVDSESIGDPERTILRCVTFADGTKMHFGISRLGACAHKIEEPPP